MTIVNPANLVKIFPYGDLKKPLMININPADNSDIATKLARNGDKSKYSIRFSGGKGNFPRPYIINAMPTPTLKKSDPKASKFEKKLLKFVIN